MRLRILFFYSIDFRKGDIIDAVMDQTLNPEAHVSEELTTRDIFYREVSNVHVLLPILVNSACEITQSERVTNQVSQYILQVNSLLLVRLKKLYKKQFLHMKIARIPLNIA